MGWLDHARFMSRNPVYTIKSVRDLASVRRAMDVYRQQHPNCSWCGRKNSTEVHHIWPVHLKPELAAEPSNFISLCRKPACHHCVGHLGDWKDCNVLVRECCDLEA